MQYDVAIVGGGASGTALLYVLSRYTNVQNIVLIEKYAELGTVNSNAKNNSQTLHVGDIETNYTIDKVRQVAPAAMMVKRYADTLSVGEREPLIRSVQKMVLGVGREEATALEERFQKFKEIFPSLKKLNGQEIATVEPEVMRGRDTNEPVCALVNQGYTVNFGLLSRSLATHATRAGVEIKTETEVQKINHAPHGYTLVTTKGDISASIVVVDADAYSLGFAKSLGFGKEFSLIPIAGSFYFSAQKLRGKVYTVQAPRMPFAAVHGDPDLTRDNATRWGPTARFYPVLEAGKFSTMVDFFKSAGLHRLQTWVSFVSILLDPLRFWYLLKNFFYDLPIVGVYFFVPEVQKIVPTMRAGDLSWARGYGGMRLQRVDTTTREMLLGEGKIVGENIIFNMTPSPGASVCLYNAMRDAEQLVKFNKEFTFDKEKMLADLGEPVMGPGEDVSLRDTYAS